MTRIDCLRDDYYDITPSCVNPPEYLCNAWNIGHARNRFVWIQNDCGTGIDAGESFAAATLVGTPRSNCTGAISYAENLGVWSDYYKFNVNANDDIHLWMGPNALANYDLWLHDPDDMIVASSLNLGDGVAEGIDHTAQKTGLYRLRVNTPAGQTDTGTYKLSLCRNTTC